MYIVADAAALPFETGIFDLAVAYNALMDSEDMPGAAREVARVLEPGGHFCVCLTPPMADAGTFATEEAGAPFVITGSYLTRRWTEKTVERDGLQLTFSELGVSAGRVCSRAGNRGLPSWFPAMAGHLSQLDPAMVMGVLDAGMMDGYDADQLLPQIGCPVLLLQADPATGGELSNEEVERAMALLPQAVYIRVEGTSHGLHIRRLHAVLRIVEDFLDETVLVESSRQGNR
jgi:pimeloyl-ACP methyl ester carboxylesterase